LKGGRRLKKTAAIGERILRDVEDAEEMDSHAGSKES
jgi:hypothetical protein